MYIYLSELISLMDRLFDALVFYDTFTGNFTNDTIEDDIKSRYILVPKYNEKEITNLFIKQLTDKKIQRRLLKDVNSRDFMHLFHIKVHNLGLYNDYIRFNSDIKKDIAINWCNENNIKYTQKKYN